MDYKSRHSILKDKFSYDFYREIEYDWKIIKKKLRKHDYVLTAVRARKFDNMCKDFLKHNPGGIVVSLGAGFDYRFPRIDNGKFTFVELDFPEVIEFKQKIIQASARNIFIGKSVLDFSWINQVKALAQSIKQPVFFMAEGLMPYFEKNDFKNLFENIRNAFGQPELFFDICGVKAFKMLTAHSGINDWEVVLKSGFNSGRDIEELVPGFKLLEEWYLPSDPDAKRGLMKLMWIIPAFKYWLYFIHGKFISR